MTIFINHKERALINSANGEIVRPSCFDDLVTYHSYLLTRNHLTYAQNILQEVFNGERVISKMVASLQRRGLTQ